MPGLRLVVNVLHDLKTRDFQIKFGIVPRCLKQSTARFEDLIIFMI